MYYFVFSYLLLPYRLHNFVAFILYYYYILWFHSYVTTLMLYTLIFLLSLLLYSVFNSLYIINTCCCFFFALEPLSQTIAHLYKRSDGKHLESWMFSLPVTHMKHAHASELRSLKQTPALLLRPLAEIKNTNSAVKLCWTLEKKVFL